MSSNILRVHLIFVFSLFLCRYGICADENDELLLDMKSYLNSRIPVFLQGLNQSFLRDAFSIIPADFAGIKIRKFFKEIYREDTSGIKKNSGDYQALISSADRGVGLVRIRFINGKFEPVSLGAQQIAQRLHSLQNELYGSEFESGIDTVGIFIRDWMARFDAVKFSQAPGALYYTFENRGGALAKKKNTGLTEDDLNRMRKQKIRSVTND